MDSPDASGFPGEHHDDGFVWAIVDIGVTGSLWFGDVKFVAILAS